jgi:hypothetical protein
LFVLHASVIILGSKSSGAYDHILLSHYSSIHAAVALMLFILFVLLI